MRAEAPRCLVLASLVLGGCSPDTEPAAFWNQQRKGANLFNRVETAERLRAAKELGVDFVRIAPDKWAGAEKDFLVGNADRYVGLPEEDADRLLQVLDAAAELELPVVLTMLSLPGARWRQNNGGDDDGRLWIDETFQDQTLRFWRDLAMLLRDHPALVAYDLLNEPHPARTLAAIDDASSPEFAEWAASVKGTAADLNRFYRRLVAAIRTVDARTPIVVESASYASPGALAFLEPVEGDNVLYSFHFYEAWLYCTRRVNGGRYSYPDEMPIGWHEGTEAWSSQRFERLLEPVRRWARSHAVPTHRILVGELGCSRMSEGVERYLEDLLEVVNREGWHWAFYSYREDTWSEMDYELGSVDLDAETLARVQSGAMPRAELTPNPIFDVLARALAPSGEQPGS